MTQAAASTDLHRDQRPVNVPAPHAWDAIGQALRAAYRHHRDSPDQQLTDVLHRLDQVD